MKKLILLSFGLFALFQIKAQDFYFTDYHSSFSRVNPATTAKNYKRDLSTHYRKKGHNTWSSDNHSIFRLNYELRADVTKHHALAFSTNMLASSYRWLPNPFKEFGGSMAYHFSSATKSKKIRSRTSLGTNFGVARHILVNTQLTHFQSLERFNVASGAYPLPQLTNWFDMGFGFHQTFYYKKRNTLEFGYGYNHYNLPAISLDETQILQRAAYRSIGTNINVARSWGINFHHFYALQSNFKSSFYRVGMRYQFFDDKPYFMDYGIIMRNHDLSFSHPSFILGTELLGLSMGVILKKIRVNLTLEPVGSEFSNTNFEISLAYFKK